MVVNIILKFCLNNISSVPLRHCSVTNFTGNVLLSVTCAWCYITNNAKNIS